ncbi:hypothetical protein D3C85_79910 [compost metagenome]
MLWLHLNDEVVSNRLHEVGAGVGFQDGAHVRTEQYFIQTHLEELNGNEFFVEIETILFAQSFQNNFVGLVDAVDNERHADELILNHTTAVRQLC